MTISWTITKYSVPYDCLMDNITVSWTVSDIVHETVLSHQQYQSIQCPMTVKNGYQWSHCGCEQILNVLRACFLSVQSDVKVSMNVYYTQ